ncbi:MAG: DUF192 domain-containing protein [Candidatus Caldarchaeum sp.]
MLLVALGLWLQIISSRDISQQPSTPANTHTEQVGQTYTGPRVLFENVEILVEVADTPEKRALGLSGRDMLPEGWGMLFVFKKPVRYSFWMYGMSFPLDVIWISEDGRVVYVVENAKPCPVDDICQPYEPSEDALYVAEVNAGFLKKYQIGVGSRVVVELGN